MTPKQAIAGIEVAIATTQLVWFVLRTVCSVPGWRVLCQSMECLDDWLGWSWLRIPALRIPAALKLWKPAPLRSSHYVL
jgi:hypothetical protein